MVLVLIYLASTIYTDAQNFVLLSVKLIIPITKEMLICIWSLSYRIQFQHY